MYEIDNNLAVLFPNTIQALNRLDNIASKGEKKTNSLYGKLSYSEDKNALPAYDPTCPRTLTVSTIHVDIANNKIKQNTYIAYVDKTTKTGWFIKYFKTVDVDNTVTDIIRYGTIKNGIKTTLTNATQENDSEVSLILSGYNNFIDGNI